MCFHESSMAKENCWFSFVKRLFISEAKSKGEEKSKRWRWFFGRLKPKQHPALATPQRALSEAREEQREHALKVAIATAAAAEAAVAAAHAAADVVRLMGASQSYNLRDKGNWNLAATKIQSAFRGHLARKAFRALKGLVKLQAVVRGWIVRRQAITKLKCLPSISNIQSKVHQRRVPNLVEGCKDGEKKQFFRPKELGVKEVKLECNNRQSWDDSMFSKEYMEAIWFRKHKAIAKRELMKKYSFSHREKRNVEMLEELVPSKENGRPSYRLEQWGDPDAYKREELSIIKPTVHSNAQKQNWTENLNHPFSLPRRSYCRAAQNSTGNNSSFPNYPVFPTYMVETESTKAKTRSTSTPKQRVGILDYYNDTSIYENRLSFWSSFDGETIGTNGSSTSQH